VREDLFEGEHVVEDKGLAHSLARARLVDECERLVGEGWAWAELSDDIKDHYSWQKLPKQGTATPEEEKRLAELRAVDRRGDDDEKIDAAIEEINRIEGATRARAFDTAERAKLGCFVEIDHQGLLAITYGVKRPKAAEPSKTAIARGTAGDDYAEKAKDGGAAVQRKAAKKDAKKTGAAAAEKPGELSQALQKDLAQQLTLAAAEAIDQDADLALVVMLATLHQGFAEYDAVRIQISGLRKPKTRTLPRETFAETVERMRGMKLGELQTLFAEAIGDALDLDVLTRQRGTRDPDAGAVICDATSPEIMAAALRKHFNAADYFERASKAHGLTALREACGDTIAKQWANRKRGEIAATCVELVTKTGWLPPELRTAHYKSPTPAASPVAAAPAKGPDLKHIATVLEAEDARGGKKSPPAKAGKASPRKTQLARKPKRAAAAAKAAAIAHKAAGKKALRGEPRSQVAAKLAARKVRRK
jgi:ParB family chromosome partitioning protein